MHSAVLARLALKVDLERALERHEFTIQYQPIFDLASHAISGAEALVRWQHPDRGQVEPLDFIPVSEETGLIVPLGAWVLEQACAQAVLWNRGDGAAPVTMSVNVSARQVQTDGFVDEVSRILAMTGLHPHLLLLEFTESVLMQDTASTSETLAGLKRLGVRLGIDDFGTGYSSLSYLRQFPIDVLKIDRSFVAASGNGPEQAAVVRSILQLGETLHIETVAEGIEEASQLAHIRTMGANLGQGFFLARPLDADAVSLLLAAGAQALDPAVAAEAASAVRVAEAAELAAVRGPFAPDRHIDPRRMD
jgi:EAL domain-containing protein (putative c-di-GMP-specific phosphodiesterase class I)